MSNKSTVKTKDFELDGFKYTLGYWNPEDALERMTTFVRIVGESLAFLIMAGADKDKPGTSEQDAKKADNKVLKEAMSALVARLSEVEVKDFIKECQDQILVNGQPVNFTTHYQGRIGHCMKVVFHQLRFQFSDFLELMPGGQDYLK